MEEQKQEVSVAEIATPVRKALSLREQRFVEEYIVDLNGKQAMVRCGFKGTRPEIAASKMLSREHVIVAILEAKDARSKRVEVTADSVITELAKLGFANMMDYITIGNDGSALVDFSALDRDKAAAIQEVIVDEYVERTGEDSDGKPTFERVKRIRFKLAEKRGSLELLGKHLKLFTEKHEHSGPNGTPLIPPPINVHFVQPMNAGEAN